jgi:hypothetical protein
MMKDAAGDVLANVHEVARLALKEILIYSYHTNYV